LAWPDLPFVAIDGAGHWIHHDRLDEFLRVVRDSFRKTGSG
jgi:pimeloyl-ACP methyl ester carboxylesterase